MSEPPAPLPPSRDEDLRQLKGRYLAAVQEAVTPSGSCLGSLIFWAIMAALAATVALIPVALGLIYRRHRNNRRSRAAVEAGLRFAHAADGPEGHGQMLGHRREQACFVIRQPSWRSCAKEDDAKDSSLGFYWKDRQEA